MTNRFNNAYEIWHNGASNPRGVARALVEAIDEAVAENGGSAGASDPAVQMIMDQLSFLVGLPQPSLTMTPREWLKVIYAVEKRRTK